MGGDVNYPQMTTDYDMKNNRLDVSTDTGYDKYDNYFAVCIFNEQIQMTVHNREKVLSITATKDDLPKGEVMEYCSEREKESPFALLRKRHFSVPFQMNVPMNTCPECHGKIEYINGIKQYLDEYAHFRNPRGWVETKNQYHCRECGKYIVQVQRTYILVHTGYYVLHVYPMNQNEGEQKPMKSGCHKPSPCYKMIGEGEWFDKKPVYWDGKCFCCSTETVVLENESAGCVTGHSSVCCRTVCPKCLLVHYAEEHDD